MVWGTFLEKNFPSSNGHLLDFGGSKPLPGWFGALIQRKWQKNGKQNGKNSKMVKSRLKKSAPECPFECGGGGCNCYLGNAHIDVAPWLKGASLIWPDS